MTHLEIRSSGIFVIIKINDFSCSNIDLIKRYCYSYKKSTKITWFPGFGDYLIPVIARVYKNRNENSFVTMFMADD